MVKKKKTTLEKQYFKSIRDLTDTANALGITAEDIVQIVPAQGEIGYYLVYQVATQEDNG